MRAFGHPLFQKDRVDLLPLIRRVNSMVSKPPTAVAAALMESAAALCDGYKLKSSDNDMLLPAVDNQTHSSSVRAAACASMRDRKSVEPSSFVFFPSPSSPPTVPDRNPGVVIVPTHGDAERTPPTQPVRLPSEAQSRSAGPRLANASSQPTHGQSSHLPSESTASVQRYTDDGDDEDDESYCSIYN